jgi:fructose-1,6-bisphosphatase/inositol monophosphatase family enzyme
VLLVREAGGRVTTFGADEKILDGDASLVATNGKIHAELLAVLNRP